MNDTSAENKAEEITATYMQPDSGSGNTPSGGMSSVNHEQKYDGTSSPEPVPSESRSPVPSDGPEESPASVETGKPEQSKEKDTSVTPPAEKTALPKPTPAPTPTPEPGPEPTGIVNPYVPYTWDRMMDEAERLREAYPELMRLSSAGESVEGREILVITLGTGNTKILLCGAHHAREYITSSFLMKMVEAYAQSAAAGQTFGGYDVAGLLSRVTLVVVPMVNPDGVNLVNNGIDSVTNRDAVEAMAMVGTGYRTWKANINGVDLNRQYPAYWEEKYDDVGRPASENYKGSASATEPEVQAMMNLARSDDFVLSASFHTKGEVIYWADSGTVNAISGAKSIAQHMKKLTGYALMPVSEKPSVFGAGFENWFRKEFLRPSFCIELTPGNGTDEPHNDKKFDSLVWKKAKCIGLLLAEEALKMK